MSNITIRHFAASALALVLAAGCSSKEPVKAPPASKSQPAAAPAAARTTPAAVTPMQQYRSDLVAGEQQIDSVIKTLNELTDPKQTDLQGAFARYKDQLARLNDREEDLKRESAAMRQSRDEYFSNWEEKVAQIDNPTIRASAEARRSRLRDAHERIVTKSAEARDAYQPFMKDLQDIKTVLGADLSKDTVADLGDAVKKVDSDGVIVKQKIEAVVAELDAVQGK